MKSITMPVSIISHPSAGASPFAPGHQPNEDFTATLLQTLRDMDMDAELYFTTLTDPGEGIARQLAREQAGLVIVVGGDGTIHSVAQGLLGSECVLGIIPTGTMNNVARSLGIPEDLKEACATLRNGRVCALDLGTINQQLFLEVAGVGLEAALYPAAEEFKKSGLFSTIQGAFKGLYTLMNFHPPHLSITFDNEKPRVYRAIQLTICNSPYYGAHLNVAPDAIMNDGWLDVVVYTNFSKGEFLRHARSIIQGRRFFTPKILYRRVQSLRVTASVPIELQADGVAAGHTPAEIKIFPGALRVIVPQTLGPGLQRENMPGSPHKKRRKRLW